MIQALYQALQIIVSWERVSEMQFVKEALECHTGSSDNYRLQKALAQQRTCFLIWHIEDTSRQG